MESHYDSDSFYAANQYLKAGQKVEFMIPGDPDEEVAMAHVEAVCISEKKGMVKREQPVIVLKTGWGIEHDAHAGDWHRQVSLLAGESIDAVKEKLPTLKNGAFAENIITRGIDLTALKIGDRLQIGEAVVLEITQIGKECHNAGCAIKKLTGDCIMPREGMFAKVIAGGTISTSDPIQDLRSH